MMGVGAGQEQARARHLFLNPLLDLLAMMAAQTDQIQRRHHQVRLSMVQSEGTHIQVVVHRFRPAILAEPGEVDRALEIGRDGVLCIANL